MPDSRKISITFFSDASYTGGAEKYLYLLASNLDRDLFNPVVMINRSNGLERLSSWLRDAGVEVQRLGYQAPFSIGSARLLMKALRDRDTGIFHINLPGPYDAGYSLAATVAKLSGIKHVVSTEHLPMVPSFPKGRILKGFNTRSIDRVITVSNDNRAHLTDIHHVPENRIRVIYNGIKGIHTLKPDVNPGGREGGKEKFVIVILGALHTRKGHMTMFDALKRLPQNTFLTVVGEGEMENEYRRFVKDSGLDDRVSFLGYREDVSEILAGADLLAVPSTLEATPYVIIEALAAGVPVVASRIYGIPELVMDGSTGLLVEPGNSVELSRAVALLVSDRRVGRRMSEESLRLFRDRFTIERSVSATVGVYEELIGSAGMERGGR